MTAVASTAPSPPRPIGQKLRRKAPIQDPVLHESTAVQRLVEYFVVVTSKPRWETSAPPKSKTRKSDSNPRKGGHRRWGLHVSPATSTDPLETRQGSSDECTDDLEFSGRTAGNIHMPQHSQTDHTFQPRITARYPLTDYSDNPLNPMMLPFCFPAGDVITPVRTYHLPHVHYFVLTNDRGRKVYGTCFTIYEEYDPKAGPWKSQAMAHEQVGGAVELEVDNRGKALYLPKVLVLLSTWPYLTAFREYLAQLYRLATATNIMSTPIERYVVNLCREIPAPPPGAYEVQVPILNSTIRFWAPPAKLPIAYVALPYKILFECLDCENVLTLWRAMIVERKILIVSSQYSILTVCSEILCSLLFPMRWSHLYVPLLPKMLCPMLDAPVPYLCGIARDNWVHAQQFLSSDTIVVDLDRNSVQYSPSVLSIPPPPLKKYNKLQDTLTETVGGVFWQAHGMDEEYEEMMSKKPHKRSIKELRVAKSTTRWNERLGGLDNAFYLAYTPDSPNLLNDTLPEDEQQKWARVQEAFHRFFVSTLKNYRRHLSFPHSSTIGTPSASKPSFNRDAFLAEQKAENVPFLYELCMTQQFDDFLARRMYSPGEPDLVFFDQSIDAKNNRSRLKFRKKETPFLQSARAHKVLTKFHAVPPNDTGLTEFQFSKRGKSFCYKTWPETFDEVLFSYPRPIPKIITAEFDRQASLISNARSSRIHDDDYDHDEIVEFFGADYDPSPEVASFTLFFFVFSALVGREWQAYNQHRREEEMKKSLSPSFVPSEETEEFIEATLTPFDLSERQKACVSDLSFGVCDSCPGISRLQSTLTYMGREAGQSYDNIVQKAVKNVNGLTGAQHGEKKPENEPDAAYEEAREVAYAQLDLAFQTLTTLTLRGLSADSESYLSLMEVCGRFSDTRYALELMERMKTDGFVADSEVLASFIAAFAHVGDEGVDIGNELSTRTLGSGIARGKVGDDAYSQFLMKQLHATKRKIGPGVNPHTLSKISTSLLRADPHEACALLGEYEFSEDSSSCSSEGSSTTIARTGGESFLGWFQYHHPQPLHRNGKRRRRKRIPEDDSNFPVTEMLARQLSLGESVLDFVYPDLAIDTNSDSCPHCSFVLSEDDVVKGWTPCAFDDYSTQCPGCMHRFVPQFIVSTLADDFEGSQGPKTPLYCEFLSPWVVRKELQSFVKGDAGIDDVIKPKWRQGTGVSATLFWNLMVLFRRYRLPFSFLLQGSFDNHLILPRKPDEM